MAVHRITALQRHVTGSTLDVAYSCNAPIIILFSIIADAVVGYLSAQNIAMTDFRLFYTKLLFFIFLLIRSLLSIPFSL